MLDPFYLWVLMSQKAKQIQKGSSTRDKCLCSFDPLSAMCTDCPTWAGDELLYIYIGSDAYEVAGY